MSSNSSSGIFSTVTPDGMNIHIPTIPNDYHPWIILIGIILVIWFFCKSRCSSCPEKFGPVDLTKSNAGEYDINYNTQASTFQKTELLPPNSTINPNTSATILSGEIQRFVLPDNKIKIDVYASLYILGGDTYDSGVAPVLGLNDADAESGLASFQPQMSQDTYDLVLGGKTVGVLHKDGDGMYKFSDFVDLPLSETKNVQIYYNKATDSTKKTLVLEGAFKN